MNGGMWTKLRKNDFTAFLMTVFLAIIDDSGYLYDILSCVL